MGSTYVEQGIVLVVLVVTKIGVAVQTGTGVEVPQWVPKPIWTDEQYPLLLPI